VSDYAGNRETGAEWLTDPDVIVFASERPLPVGSSEEHSVSDLARGLLGRRQEEVRADWDKVLNQLRFLLDGASGVVKGYELDEVSFELGFSAQGKVVFVASGEVSTTITATFRRSAKIGVPTQPEG
jgi:hypothetical protein